MNDLRHQVLDDGRVLVTLKGQIARLQSTEVKRFAWAVLNDLDPEAADEAGYVAPMVEFRESPPSTSHLRGPWQLMAILLVLTKGQLHTPNIAKRVSIDRTQAAIQLKRMMKRGWVNRLSEGRAWWPALWEINGAGRAALADHQKREAS